ncbi:MAG: carboxypeptidase regulatory-like domain-containing protein, partial [Pyrinomonadaceae bacterium]
QLPGPKRFNALVNNLLGGWSVAGVTTIQSGSPLSLFGTNTNNAFGVTGDRAQIVAGCNLVTSGSVTSRLNNYFNTSCIARANPNAPLGPTNPAVWPVIDPSGTTGFGNSGVGIVTGPGQNNSDIAIIKRTPFRLLGEGANVEFRTEFFNAFNHPQFGNPGQSVSSPATFGVISTTSVNPRIIQFGLKLNF